MNYQRFVLGLVSIYLSSLILTGCGLSSAQPTPTPSLIPTISEEPPATSPPDPLSARQASLEFIRTSYTESAPPEDLAWAEADVTPEGLVGATTFQYAAGEWQVTVTFPVVAPEALVYQVEVSNPATGFNWQGTVDANGQVTEASVSTGVPPGWVQYTNDDYLFTFNYPSSWTLTEIPGGEDVPGGESANGLYLTQGPYRLVVQFKSQAEDTVLGPSGRPAGEIEERGTVTFFGQEIPKHVLAFEGLDKQVFYGERVDELEFYMQLDDESQGAYQDITIPDELQAEVDQILGTFVRTGELDIPPDEPVELNSYHNDAYQFSIQYPSNWEHLETPHAIFLSLDTQELIIEFRRIYESISIGPTGTPAGELMDQGSVTILGRSYPRMLLVYEGADRAVYYNRISTIDAGDVQFAISLNEKGDDPQASLPDAVQSEADRIVQSLSVDFELEECIDELKFVSDVTVPDGATFPPGKSFVKTWRLRNEGTCTWSTDYSLVYVEGEPMGYTEPIPLPSQVEPGNTVDLSVSLVAPESEGTYRGDWMLRNPDEELFGAGEDVEDPFWVEIQVGEVPGELSLGDPDWEDTFNNSANWYLLDTANTKFTVKDGQLVMQAEQAGQAEEWGISTHGALDDFYLEATFTTGSACSGLDRYGVLVRAPEPDRGYVYGFSCDGRYRLYKWDGENYVGLQEWASSAHIQPGPESTNRLGFWADGKTLRLYANGRLLVEIEDTTYDEGRFGLFIGSTDTDNLKVFVEEIAYWELNE